MRYSDDNDSKLMIDWFNVVVGCVINFTLINLTQDYLHPLEFI